MNIGASSARRLLFAKNRGGLVLQSGEGIRGAKLTASRFVVMVTQQGSYKRAAIKIEEQNSWMKS